MTSEQKEKGVTNQKIILYVRSSGEIVTLTLTQAIRLEPGISLFISRERKRVETELKVTKAQQVDTQKSHGRQRSKKELRDAQTGRQKRILSLETHLSALSDSTNVALKLEEGPNSILAKSSVPSGVEGLWADFAANADGLLLNDAQDIALVRRFFEVRLQVRRNERGAIDRLRELFRELDDSRHLDFYAAEITSRFGR